MKVVGLTTHTRPSGRLHSAVSASDFHGCSVSPWRAARASTTSNPTLCRVPRYRPPGLPRPTTNFILRLASLAQGRPVASSLAQGTPISCPSLPFLPSLPCRPCPSSSLRARRPQQAPRRRRLLLPVFPPLQHAARRRAR